jgi:hypothetical protein
MIPRNYGSYEVNLDIESYHIETVKVTHTGRRIAF